MFRQSVSKCLLEICSECDERSVRKGNVPSLLQVHVATAWSIVDLFDFILQEKQQREIEQTRNDMMTVIQAIRSEKYSDVEGSASQRNAKELPQDLATMRAEYETKIAKLQEEHQEALREAKSSMTMPLVTVEGEAQVK